MIFFAFFCFSVLFKVELANPIEAQAKAAIFPGPPRHYQALGIDRLGILPDHSGFIGIILAGGVERLVHRDVLAPDVDL